MKKLCLSIWCLVFLMNLDLIEVRGQILQPLAADSGAAFVPSSSAGISRYLPRKWSTNLQLGSYFTSSQGFGNSFSTFINPTFTYAATSKLRINAGVSVINTTLYGVRPWYYGGFEQSLSGNYMHAILSVGADYHVNDRLSLSGYLFKDIDLYNEIESTSPYKRINPEGGYLRVGYKVTDHFHIEGGIGYSRGINPYGSYYGSPFAPSFFPY